MAIFEFVSHIVFVLVIGFYVISALQWYSYKLERIIFHFNRYDWHLFFFLIPIFVYYLAENFFWIYLYVLLIPTMVLWYRKLDKKLIFTARVKRFFLFLFLATIFQNMLCLVTPYCANFGVILPLFIAIFISMLFEKILFNGFKRSAMKKLEESTNLTIIAITASFGKTSIKNYLFQILSHKYNCYMTPRSVNTLGGIMKDINDDLPSQTQIYIVEAGARLRGDINEIATLVNPHYVIVGKIGEQHIEYFKTLENIRNTKMELLNSNRLKNAYVHVSANVNPDSKTVVYGDELKNVRSTLDGLYFDVELDGKLESFFTPLLGEFNAMNILACIMMAKSKMTIEEIKGAIANLKGVEHRLQRIDTGGKLIIDDSFNGNLEGMLASYELASTYDGRRVIITPGIVESTTEANIELAKRIDDVFDIVILTGKSNLDILDKNINRAEKIVVKDKREIEKVLGEFTRKGDLILFSNDTPTFM
ncbi:MAG TPA: UDP-N-acetylmuramoyl-tripeptide--D-alanyl-D-alanine ligase [Sulfurospirillum arcachonense]|nr:UDP-N-acetylmuramoyl-tripeptide--D-alanyl-D-alanine ligase [Sulfurospirillum arcachonense]HIP44644.1 UDP-N-acetylmuramoyl-tripeptide--D-alanyl-D-alanine ligase [Sulfurospirillum arcachonense]